MSTKIYSYNNGESSRLLADALGVRRLKHNNSRWRPRAGDTLINWGKGIIAACRVLNLPGNVGNVTNKKTFFELFRQGNGFNVPPFFFSRAAASEYMVANPGSVMVCRTVLDGHEGRGIVMCDNPGELPNCSLYTLYIKKKAEYRIHVMAGEVIDEVQKKRRQGHTEGDQRIRNTANGFVFARTDVVVPPSVRDAAVRAVQFYGLDFGAVDVIWNNRDQAAYVLEINTAPGIEGTTVQRYAAGFRRFFNV